LAAEVANAKRFWREESVHHGDPSLSFRNARQPLSGRDTARIVDPIKPIWTAAKNTACTAHR